jgi:hypothetical protein
MTRIQRNRRETNGNTPTVWFRKVPATTAKS